MVLLDISNTYMLNSRKTIRFGFGKIKM